MYRLVSLAIAAAMVGCLLITPTAAATQSQVTLTVSVVDQSDAAVDDATVTATWDDGEQTATTASNGRAFVDVPQGADVSIDVDHEEYTRNFPVTVEDASEQDVTVRVSQKGQATVVVTDSENQSLVNTTVELRRDGRTVATGQTDADGRFETDTIEQGRYQIEAVKPGYYRESISERVRTDGTHEISLERGTVRLDVTVVDDHFDPAERLENAVVQLDDADGEVARVRASGGTASLSVPVNTDYRVTVTKENYTESSQQLTVRESDRSVEIATQRVPTLTVEPQNTQVVVGEVTTLQVVNAYSEPLPNITVQRNGQAVGETDANGQLTVTIESAGENEFRAVGDDLESDPVVVNGIVPADEQTATEPTETTDGTNGDGPGFGVIAALLAIVAVAVIRR
ncbi:carboxypeptidase regulatory-like domain-containing protein [Natronomonas halophila]|uniref:carboxypeptidase regulatory-like domain-containing protein n=1 Tax=Natronomonas halophila TaxID=2747817 RepID=UPI0015B4AA1B|nr:carboxypeptidase-like regulatory domain-containing protein [Natronomonas halophila]QLD85787.1 carboxypeptidase regulatory-like domain-containing protein [Natronomonas halophila]